jgi:hypothetical protein
MKTQMFSAYIYGLNYKPFGKGGFHLQKRRLLNIFVATQNATSPLWIKYRHRIASDLDLPCSTEAENEALFRAVATLPSFHLKESCPKLGRWFSWNQCFDEQGKEFWALKMLLESHLEEEDDGETVEDLIVQRRDLLAAGREMDPRAELAALRNAGNGGLRLAYRLMTAELHQDARILYTVTGACWAWYTQQVKTVKTPTQAFLNSARLAAGGWAREPHLWQTIDESLRRTSSLAFMLAPSDSATPERRKAFARKVLSLTWQVAAASLVAFPT